RAPGGTAVRLVVEVESDDGRVVAVALGQRHPVVDPALLGEVRRIPEVFVQVASWMAGVVVENDLEAEFSRLLDDQIERLESGGALERLVDGRTAVVGVGSPERDAARRGAGFEYGVAPRQPDDVEAKVADLVQHAAVVARPEPVDDPLVRL